MKQPKGHARARQRQSLEEQPRRESIGSKWQNGWSSKHRTFLLGPLRRFLTAAVGRPWDNVYSELRRNVDRRNAAQNDFLEQVDWLVETQVRVEGKKVFGRFGFQLQPGALFVCPRTRLLRAVPARRRQVRVTAVERVDAGRDCQYRLMAGIWYRILVKPLRAATADSRDVVLGKPATDVSPSEANEAYGRLVFAVEKRQVGKRELKKVKQLLAAAS